MFIPIYSTAKLTDTQEGPSASRRAALAILALKRESDASDDAFAERVGLTSGKQQVNAMRKGGGVTLDVAYAVATKMRLSLDEMLGLTGEQPAPSLVAPIAHDLESVARELEEIRERLAELQIISGGAAGAAERYRARKTGRKPPKRGRG